jgi:hypothetical protein
MANDADDKSMATAIDALTQAGFTEYESRTYVALLVLGGGTAKEVAELAAVPLTRVYDAADGLEDGGLVDVQYASPRRFYPVSLETTVDLIRRRDETTVGALADALRELEPMTAAVDRVGVWTTTGADAITDRLAWFVSHADDAVSYLSDADEVDDDILAALRTAAEDDVAVVLGGPWADAAATDLAHPGIHATDPGWGLVGETTGRVLVVDDEVGAIGVTPPGGEETAIWARGGENSLVVLLRSILDSAIDVDSPED